MRAIALSPLLSGVLLLAASCGNQSENVVQMTAALASTADCQRVSDEFGVVANVTWGIAPPEIQTWWIQNSCATSPTTSTDVCQKASDIFGITANVTFGYAPTSVQTWWTSHSCTSSPQVSESLCLRASDTYGIVANVTWGVAPPYVSSWWTQNSCATVPHGTAACQKAADLYGIVAGQTFGFAPATAQTWWTANNCAATTTTATGQLCKNAANLYAISTGSPGGAPAAVQTWWNANCSGLSPSVTPTCQGMSEMFGATAGVTWGYAVAPALFLQDWWIQHSCQTKPLFSTNTCQRASNTFGMTPQTSAFAPSYVQTWWTSSSCTSSPQSDLFVPNTNAMTATTPRTLPAAPTNLTITGQVVEYGATYLKVQWKDNNMPNAFTHTEDWEVYNGTPYARGVADFDTGAPGTTVTAKVPMSWFIGQANPCLKIRGMNANGVSMFSNVACYSGGTGGVPSGSNVGLGNGVLMTDPAGTNAIFMPTLGQQFKIQWSVCNNGNAASGAVSVTLRQTSNALTVTDTSFNLSAVAAGTCVTQSSALMTVSSPGQWNWDVYLSGAYAGGLGYNFF